ncbi:MAG: flagellar motor protein MotB [Firmicutes bacterium]|nr:flagellar motor protein MotB [[Eubacterium] siraeum]MCM1486942.1 flagellar motor protein MotB [Bacillota bacterium]
MPKKKERSKIDPNAWMNTYSDMVTLLMCFFVLLYASSTPDEVKFQYIFQNFTSSGKYINPFVMDKEPNRTDSEDDDGNSIEPPGEAEDPDQNITNVAIPNNFNDLAAWLTAAAQSSDFADDISVSVNSSGSITIRFNDGVLFEPDSAVLTDNGRLALSRFFPGIQAINQYIGKINVSGHTAKGLSEINDWDLSGARASSVIKFMDFRRIVDPDIYQGSFFGPYKPIADNDTEEGKRQNRRVEITITRNNNHTQSNAVIQDILKYDYGISHGGTGNLPEEVDKVSQIIDRINEKYNVNVDESGQVLGNESGPEISSPVMGIPDDKIHEVDEEGNIITDESERTPAETTE